MSSDSSEPMPFPLEPTIDWHPLILPSSMSVEDAIARMSQTQTSCVLIVEQQQLVGLVTEQDIVRLVAAKCDLIRTIVAEVMTPPAMILTATEQDVFSVLPLMCQHQVNYLPVVDEQGCPIGMITSRRILDSLSGDDIRDRKRLEETLHQHALTFEQIFDGIIITDFEGRIIDWNPGAESMFGYVREEVLGQTPGILHQPEEAATLTSTILAEIHRHGRWSGEISFIRKDGTAGICETVVVLFHDRQGNPIGTVGVNRDITARKQAEIALSQLNQDLEMRVEQRTAELAAANTQLETEIRQRTATEAAARESEARLRLIIDSVPALLSYVDAQQRYGFNNKLYEEWFGCSVTELAGKQICEVVGAANYERIRGYIKTALSGQAVTYETPVTLCDGTDRYVQVDYVIDLDAAGAVQGFSVLVQDLSERQRAEAALRESEERFRQLAETVREIFFIKDIHPRRLLYVNPAYEQVSGRSCQSLYRNPDSFLEAVHPKDRPRMQAVVEQQKTDFVETEYRIVRPDGKQRWLKAHTGPIRNAQGEPYRIVGIVEDITARKQVEAHLKHQLEFDRRVASISSRFINLAVDKIAAAIDQALQEIGEFTQVDTGYVFQLSEERTTLSMVHEWVKPGGEPQRQNAQNLSAMAFPWTVAKLCRHEVVHIPSVAQLPLAAAVDRANWQSFNLQSLIAVPLSYQGTVMGWAGFASFHQEKIWSEDSIRLLQIIGEILTNAMQRQRTEKALQLARERLHFLLATSPTLIYSREVTGNRRFTFMSENARQVLGYTPAEFLADADFWRTRIHREDILRVFSNPGLILEQGQRLQEYRFLHKNGSYRWMHDEMKLVRDATGKPLEIIGYCTDVSQQILKDEMLRESEARFRTTFEQAALGIAHIDVEGEILWMNSQFCDLLGYSPREMLAQRFEDIVHPADWQVMEQLRACQVQPYVVERRCLRKDDSLIWVSLAISPRCTPANELLYFIVIAENISIRKQAEETLRQARDILEQQVAARTAEIRQTNVALRTEMAEREKLTQDLERSNLDLEQFAYMASHDLQEPLRAVNSFARLLAQKYQGQLDATAEKYIHYIVDGASRMQHLIQDLLTYSRVGRQTLDLQPVDCNTVLVQVQHNLASAIAESSATLIYDLLPTLNADPTQLVQLFQNLIGNAIKYRSDEPPQICISALEQDDRWCFSIQDNGIGIEPQYAQRIFTLFQRLHTRQEYPGTGIGLALCKKIVERHQGELWVESELGAGATFYITLPNADIVS